MPAVRSVRFHCNLCWSVSESVFDTHTQPYNSAANQFVVPFAIGYQPRTLDTGKVRSRCQIYADICIVMHLQIRSGQSVAHFVFHRFLDDIGFVISPCQQIDLRAAIIVATPIVMEQGGRLSTPKLCAASAREVESIKISRVGELKLDPGSFMAILPSRPMPINTMSIPPKVWIRCSYRRQYSMTASCGIVPSMVNTFCLSMSIWLRNKSFSCEKLLPAPSEAKGNIHIN